MNWPCRCHGIVIAYIDYRRTSLGGSMFRLQLTHVTKHFRGALFETHVIRDVNMIVNPGEFLAVVGRAGSGKTTLFNASAMLDRFTGGEYFIDGKSVNQLPDSVRANLRNRKFGLLFPRPNLIPSLTIRDNIQMPLHYLGIRAADRISRTRRVLHRFGLREVATKFPRELPSLIRQTGAIARAVVANPSLIFADEPTHFLGRLEADLMLTMLADVNRDGIAIVMLTRHAEFAQHAQRFVLLVDGEMEILSEMQNGQLPDHNLVKDFAYVCERLPTHS
jgi:putative ABC transport system ATP-binding protein